MKKAFAIRAHIYKNSIFGDCSNNGISNRFNEVLILHPEGCVTVDLDNPPENLCDFEVRTIGANDYKSVIPYVSETNGKWYMAGGSFVFSSDSRFCDFSNYPLSLHDRTE